MSRVGSVYLLDGIPAKSTQNMKEDNWLALRRQGIGGSDIGAIMGLNPWRSEFETWCDKKGLIPPKEMTEDMEFGIYMEPVLRGWAQARLQVEDPEVKVFSSPYLYSAPDDEHALANIDGVVVHPETDGRQDLGLEIKTASVYQTTKWEGEEIPDHYYAQDQWYMRVTGLQGWWMAPLVGKKFFLRYVPRNEAFIEQQKTAAATFWQKVEANIMPAPAGTEGDLDILLQMFPNASEELIQDEGLEATMREYTEIQAQLKDLTATKDRIKAELELRVGEAKGILAGAFKATWSRYDTSRLDGEKLKAEYPEVYEACKKTARQGRFTISINKPKKEKEIA
jgi:putative phage-type endonuclease